MTITGINMEPKSKNIDGNWRYGKDKEGDYFYGKKVHNHVKKK